MILAGMKSTAVDDNGDSFVAVAEVFAAKRRDQLSKSGTPEWDQGAEDERPWEMLSEAAWSLLWGPLHPKLPSIHWEAFSDSNTKLQVVLSDANGGQELWHKIITHPHEELIKKLVLQETDNLPIQRRSVTYLGRGILTSRNAELFDIRDLERMAIASKPAHRSSSGSHRTYFIRAILESQIDLLEEIVQKNWHHDCSEFSDFSYNGDVVQLLEDNQRYLKFLQPHSKLSWVRMELEQKCQKKGGFKRKAEDDSSDDDDDNQLVVRAKKSKIAESK
jgi:hypothetical protein